MDNKRVQTRSISGELKYHNTLTEALIYAKANEGVWKISFSFEEERVRLVRSPEGWVYEDIHENRFI